MRWVQFEQHSHKNRHLFEYNFVILLALVENNPGLLCVNIHCARCLALVDHQSIIKLKLRQILNKSCS